MISSDSSAVERYARQRELMVENQLRGRGIRDERVLEAMLRIPRHEFVPVSFQDQAYEDRPLPIGENQTISQPFIVAVSLQALQLNRSEHVLEIGTGSGYQTALLCVLSRFVYSIERHESLAREAETVLARLGIENVRIAVGDGSRGWPEHAPFDAMLVSAAAPNVPQSLLSQLSENGSMVIPVGPPEAQKLQLVRKDQSQYAVEHLEACRFVPLIGAEGY